MPWEKLSSITSTGSSSTVNSGTIGAKTFLQTLFSNLGESAGQSWERFNSDSGNNYADRKSANGGADATRTSVAEFRNLGVDGATTPGFEVQYGINISAQEKLVIGFSVGQNTAGAGNAPTRIEWVGKHVNTSTQTTNITYTSSGGTYTDDSNLTIFGTD